VDSRKEVERDVPWGGETLSTPPRGAWLMNTVTAAEAVVAVVAVESVDMELGGDVVGRVVGPLGPLAGASVGSNVYVRWNVYRRPGSSASGRRASWKMLEPFWKERWMGVRERRLPSRSNAIPSPPPSTLDAKTSELMRELEELHSATPGFNAVMLPVSLILSPALKRSTCPIATEAEPEEAEAEEAEAEEAEEVSPLSPLEAEIVRPGTEGAADTVRVTDAESVCIDPEPECLLTCTPTSYIPAPMLPERVSSAVDVVAVVAEEGNPPQGRP
jgi:hypothetical protein